MSLFSESFMFFNFWVVMFSSYIIIIGFDRNVKEHYMFKEWTPYIPNSLSILRIFISPLLFIIFLTQSPMNFDGVMFVNVIFGFCCVLDITDGQFARKYNCESEWGKFLDPFADKVMLFWLSLITWNYSACPKWILVIVLIREFYSNLQRFFMKRKSKDIGATIIAKTKTVVQFTVLYLYTLQAMPNTMVFERFAKLFNNTFMNWASMIMLFLTLLSFFQFFDAFRYLKLQNINDVVQQRTWKNFVPNAITWSNFLGGITAAYVALFSTSDHKWQTIVFLILVAAFLDVLDGASARKLGVASEKGCSFDNVADLGSFGLATAIVVFVKLKSVSVALAVFVGAFVFYSIHYRLKRFTEGYELQEDKSKKMDFTGLPSPAGSILIVCCVSLIENPQALVAAILGISLLLTSEYTFLANNSLKKQFPVMFIVAGVLLILNIMSLGYGLIDETYLFTKTSKLIHLSFTVNMTVYALSGIVIGRRNNKSHLINWFKVVMGYKNLKSA